MRINFLLRNIDKKIFYLKRYLVILDILLYIVFVPIYIFTAYFVLKIKKEFFLYFIFITFTIAGLMILYSVFHINYFSKKYLSNIFDFLEGKKECEEDILQKCLKKFFKLSVLKSFTLSIQIFLGMLVFFVYFLFYLHYDFYKLIMVESLFLFFMTLWVFTYYFFAERIIFKISNTSIFIDKIFLKYIDENILDKFHFILFYAILLMIFSIFSIFSFIGLYFGEQILKRSYREHFVIQNKKNNLFFKENLNYLEYIVQKIEESFNFAEIKENRNSLQNAILQHLPRLSSIYVNNYLIYDLTQKEIVFLFLEDKNNFANYFEKIDLSSIKDFIGFYKDQENGFYIYMVSKKHYLQVFVFDAKKFKSKFLNLSSSDAIELIMDHNYNILFSSDSYFEGKNLKDFVDMNNYLKFKGEKLWNYFFYKKRIYELTLDENEDILNSGIFFDKNQTYFEFYIFILLLGILLFFLGVISSFLIFYLIRYKTRRVIYIYKTLDQLFNGELRLTKTFVSNDEFGLIGIKVYKFGLKLQETILQIKEVLEDITKTAHNFNEMSKEQLKNSELESAAIEEMSAAIEEISSSMDNISTFAKEQNQLVQILSNNIQELTQSIRESKQSFYEIHEKMKNTYEFKEKNEKEIQNTIDSVSKIKEISSKINSVLNLVKDIADKISLLSLNASIEAARAGEFGRGFAVVAEEISKLSEKTRNSIKEIRDLIVTTQEKISKVTLFGNFVQENLNYLLKDLESLYQLFQNAIQVVTKQEMVNLGVLNQIQSVSHHSNEIKNNIYEKKVSIEEITKNIISIHKIIMTSNENSKIFFDKTNKAKEEIEKLVEILKFFKI